MTALRIFFAAAFAVLVGYTLVVIVNHGFGLFPVFFGDIAKVAWPGQFNLDFLVLLSFGALWVAWRHQFTPIGFVLGLATLFGGGIFLSGYLVWASVQAKGDAKTLLLGAGRNG